jgi:hypothetical protein
MSAKMLSLSQKNKTITKRAAGVAQCIRLLSLEFKPQYHKKAKTKESVSRNVPLILYRSPS